MNISTIQRDETVVIAAREARRPKCNAMDLMATLSTSGAAISAKSGFSREGGGAGIPRSSVTSCPWALHA